MFVSVASAHLPTWGEPGGENFIEDIDISIAFYQEIGEAGQVDTYTFNGEQGQRLHAGINIPAIDGLEDYGVTMALLGPGLPPDGLARLPGQHADADGALIFPDEKTESFFEPFTQTRYWGRQSADLDLPATGEYHIAVWNAEGQPGKYVIDVGEREEFGLLGFLKLPYWWVRVHHFFGHSTYVVAGGLALAVAVTGLTLRRKRRRKRITEHPAQPAP